MRTMSIYTIMSRLLALKVYLTAATQSDLSLDVAIKDLDEIIKELETGE